MNKIQAYDDFWNSFGLNAYDENSVPEDAVLPYITYELVNADFGTEVAVNASIWDKSYSWKRLSELDMEITDKITKGGMMVNYDDGAFWVRKLRSQRVSENDASIKRILMDLELEFID